MTGDRQRRVAPRLEVQLEASRILSGCLLALHSMAAGVAVSGALPAWLAPLVLAMIVWQGVQTMRLHALRSSPGAVVRIRLHGDDECAFTRRDGGIVAGRVAASSFVVPWLIVVRLDTGRRFRKAPAVTVFPDALSADDFRRLSVRLRWTRLASDRDSSRVASL